MNTIARTRNRRFVTEKRLQDCYLRMSVKKAMIVIGIRGTKSTLG